jgi:hypothetical protein
MSGDSTTSSASSKGASVDLKGRTAKAHIDKWKQYGKKAEQHATAAAILLLEVKSELPRGEYTIWLKSHDIEPRTARRLVLEHCHPEKREERREENRERERQVRAQAATCGRSEPQKSAQDNVGEMLRAWGAVLEGLAHLDRGWRQAFLTNTLVDGLAGELTPGELAGLIRKLQDRLAG